MNKDKIIVQDNSLVLVTPKGKSTHIYKTKEVIQALEKQISQKVVYKSNFTALRYCPSCGVRFIGWGMKYCGECGQRLDWSEVLNDK